MSVLFIESDPVTRGLMHCLATMAGLDHAILASAEQALDLLRGQRPNSGAESWSVAPDGQERIGLVVTELELADMSGYDLAAIVRDRHPQVRIFAHTRPELICGGDLFDRVFCKPHSAEAVIRAAVGVVGEKTEHDLFRVMFPQLDAPAA